MAVEKSVIYFKLREPAKSHMVLLNTVFYRPERGIDVYMGNFGACFRVLHGLTRGRGGGHRFRADTIGCAGKKRHGLLRKRFLSGSETSTHGLFL